MKKILSLVIIVLIMCGCNNNTARSAVERYLKKYKTLDSEVLVNMEEIIGREDLNSENKELYRTILKKQYKDLNYEILEEEYDDEVSYVTVKIKVYDYYKANRDASIHLSNHPDDFNDEFGNYDVSKYNSYRLNNMKDVLDKVEYTIIFTVTKNDNKYEVMQPTENDLMKLHGIYNYDVD